MLDTSNDSLPPWQQLEKCDFGRMVHRERTDDELRAHVATPDQIPINRRIPVFKFLEKDLSSRLVSNLTEFRRSIEKCAHRLEKLKGCLHSLP